VEIRPRLAEENAAFHLEHRPPQQWAATNVIWQEQFASYISSPAIESDRDIRYQRRQAPDVKIKY
jgi:hypothetical protein